MKVGTAFLSLLLVFAFPQSAHAASPSIVISQFYAGGGDSGATLRNDFVELFNRGGAAVSVTGWSIQYSSARGTTWEVTALLGSIEPGHYYLIQLAGGGRGSLTLPAAQVTGTATLNANAGKIALVSNTSALNGGCPSRTGIVDLAGYGPANCSEASPAPALTNTTALIRMGSGCTDTDDNLSDFAAGSPAPRNASSARFTCDGVTAPPGPGPSPQPGQSTAASLIFPHFVEGGGYQTTFTFNNLSGSAATVILDLFSQSGSALGSTIIPLAAFGSGKYTLATTVLTVGWARATCQPAEVIGNETIQWFNSAGVLLMEASVFAAQPDAILRLPVYEKDGFSTGVAIVNLSPAGSSISMTLRSSDGMPLPVVTLSLSSFQQSARFVPEIFPGVSDFEGTLEISSRYPAAAVALRQNVSSGVFSTLPVSPQSGEMYFSPRGGISARIVQEIERAQTSIDIEMYTFTRDEIADALIAAKLRRVAIRILADSSEAAVPGSDVARLEAAGIPLKRTNGGGGGIMHNKVSIFDGQVLFTGSYNWSTAAELSNDENALFMRTPAVIAAYQSRFNSLWVTR